MTPEAQSYATSIQMTPHKCHKTVVEVSLICYLLPPIHSNKKRAALSSLMTAVSLNAKQHLIRRIQWIGYDVLGFLGVGVALDIFQNILLLYFQYDLLVFTGYGVLSLFPSWSLVSASTDTPYLP
nr:hypothetical protein [Tanacetum cinerariifolium]